MQDSFLPFGKIKQVKYVKDKLLFPISWLQKQDYCEYQIFLENIQGVKAAPTVAMSQGTQEHERLYSEFAEKAAPATLEQMLTESKTVQLLSRELKVEDIEHGIYGYIDEVWLTPDSFIVIDDKPGMKAYPSNIHQIYGYCLAFRATISADKRPVIAALRQRGTDQFIWESPFNEIAEESITRTIGHIHDLLNGRVDFKGSGNPNKCRSCRLKPQCDRKTD